MTKGLLNSDTAPHVVLGVRPDASPSDLTVAFARSSKRIKTSNSSPFTIEDLTSALSNAETLARKKEFGLKYTVPANLTIFQPDASFSYEGQELRANMVLEDIDISAISKTEKEDAASTFLCAAINQLFVWNWQQSAQYARVCLRLSNQEVVRDEALNVLAVTLAIAGEGSKALDALKKAVEGHWNLALQTNLSLIATELDPDLAISHISYLVDGAENEDEKLKACLLAIALWKKSQMEHTGSDDDDDFEPLPRKFLDSIHNFVKNPTISEENFYKFASFLARVDAVNLKASETVRNSVHHQTKSSKAVELRSNGLLKFMMGITKIAGISDTKRPWLNEEIDDLLKATVNGILDQDDEENSQFFFNIGFSMLNDGVDCSTHQRIMLRALISIFITGHLDENATPSSKFIGWLLEANSATEKNDANLTDEQKSFVIESIGEGANTLARLYHDAGIETANNVRVAAQQLDRRTKGFFNSLTADRADNRRIAVAINDASNNVLGDLSAILPLVSNTEVKNAVGHMIANLRNSIALVSQHL